jgi:hypothetical protein
LLLARLALDDERNLWTISITEPRRPDELERGDREPSLLLDVDVGSGASRPFAVVGRDSFWGDVDLRDIGRRIQDGDNRSKVEGGSVDMTSSDIEGRWKCKCSSDVVVVDVSQSGVYGAV